MKNNLVWLLPTILYSSFCDADVLISEVLYDTPGSDTNEEWVELYNPECRAISLSGYSIADNGTSFDLSGSIPAGGYFTIARNVSGFSDLYAASPDLGGMSLALGNGGDWVELSNGSDVVDMVAWENKVSGWSIEAKDVSIYRITSVDTDVVDDWGVSDSDSPGTGSLTQNCSTDSADNATDANTDTDSNTDTDDNTDTTVVNEADYYQDAIGLSGAELKAKLQDIISTNHTKLTYSEVWTALQYTDEDPNNTNNVILFYSQRSADKDDRDGTSGSDNDSWNREHVWAKSLGFPNTSQYGYTDLHHLRPTDKTVNSSRANKSFDNGGSAQGEAANTFTDSDSWEPSDVVKGDVARMIFYMDTRYDGSDGNMPDLEIIDNTNTSSGEPNIGVLCTLYQWNTADPVDDDEQRRNNRIAEEQGNRNPFIDNPQWVESIWGDSCR